jgi:hypothetical protein
MIKGKMLSEDLAKELEKVGVKKDEIDEYMVWGVYKLALGVMKIKWSLDGNGIEGNEADEKLNKIIKMISEKSADDLHEMMHKSGDEGWE